MKAICVFCGSTPGARPDYVEAADALGQALVRRDLALVYGGAKIGLMGRVADSVLAGGGRVTGVMPDWLANREIVHDAVSELHVVDSMHERKSRMADLSDGFIALPGGLGTLEELLEALTWSQLGIHAKPCAVLNVAGYFDGLLRFLETAAREEFVRDTDRQRLLVGVEPDALVSRMLSFVVPESDKIDWALGKNKT